MRFVPLADASADQHRQAARLLVDGFAELAPEAWPDLAAGRSEVEDAAEAGRICLLAVGGVSGAEDPGAGDPEAEVLGWIGGIPMYDGRVWELHPLVVRPDVQRRGIGRALVAELERAVAGRGGVTLYLGTDDETGRTNLAGVDLYPGALEKLIDLESVRGHPSDFYRALGFEVVGVVPDANGFGKPDIMMAKRVGAP